MSNIIPFSFESHQLRSVIGPDDEPMFVASDVAKILGYDQTANLLVHCKRSWILRDVNKINGLHPSTKWIPESDLYRATMRSDMPNADRFQDWVCEDVLPSIRKTGSYSLKRPSDHPLMQSAKIIPSLVTAFKRCGIDATQAGILANQTATKITGGNLLEAAGVIYLESPEQTKYLNVSDLVDGISGQAMNKLIESAGFQVRQGKEWVLTETGKQYARVLDSGKSHGNGQMIQHIKWSPDVVRHLSLGVVPA